MQSFRPCLEHLQGLCKQTLHYSICENSKKYPSNGFANKVCNLVNFANRGSGFAYMQTFPPLCIYNFDLPRRTPSPRPPHPARFLYARPPSLPRAPALTEVDGAELTRTTTATNAAWAGRRLARRPGLGDLALAVARRKKNTRARSVKKF